MARLHDRERHIGVTERLIIHKNAHVQVDGQIVAGNSTKTVDAKKDQMPRIVAFDTAAGTTITLPPATGSGRMYRFMVTVTATSNSHILQCASAADEFNGSLTSIDVDTADATLGFAAQDADGFDTITFNRTTSGLAEVGDYIEVQDILAGRYHVHGVFRANGTVVTPFSAAV